MNMNEIRLSIHAFFIRNRTISNLDLHYPKPSETSRATVLSLSMDFYIYRTEKLFDVVIDVT